MSVIKKPAPAGFLFELQLQHNYNMPDEEHFEEFLRGMILEICEVLHRNGFRTAQVGAIMRLIGVPEEQAASHDDDYFDLDQEFVAELAERKKNLDLDIPPGTVIH